MRSLLVGLTGCGRAGPINLLDLLLVGAAVNSPWGPLVVKPVGNLVKSLLKTVPVPSQAPKHPIKVLAGRLYLHFPVVQVTQARPAKNPECHAVPLGKKDMVNAFDGGLLR